MAITRNRSSRATERCRRSKRLIDAVARAGRKDNHRVDRSPMLKKTSGRGFQPRRKDDVNNYAKYQYEPVNQDGTQIRVLYLVPGKRKDPIHVRLEVVPFEQDADQSYTALSYTWGSQLDPAKIIVDNDAATTLEITQNLMEALQHLRHRNRHQLLWIDAICIDQKNKTERGHQVGIMRPIFRRARRVIAWLGPETNDSGIAFDCLEQINRHVVLRPDFTLDALADDPSWADPNGTLPFDKAQIRALANLFGRPWFKRLWVWQEVRLGDSRCIAICGTDKMVWSSFRNAVRCLHRKTTLDYGSCTDSLMESLDGISDLTVQPDHMAWAFDSLRSRECADPRDRIYVGLGLAGIDVQSFVTPDYTKLAQEVYEDAAIRYIQRYSSLKIFDYIANVNQLPGLPSWVPDWSAKSGALRFYCANNGIQVSGQCYHYSEHSLTVKGRIMADISQVEPFGLHPAFLSYEKAETAVRDFVSRLLARKLITKRSQDGAAYCPVFCGDYFADVHIPVHGDSPTRSEFESALRKLLGQPDCAELDSLAFQSACWRAYNNCIGRGFFICEDGTFGLAPQTAQAEDIVVFILGCRFPMALRRLGEGGYRVLGPSYCSRDMHLECILGPLPDEYETIIRVGMDGANYTAYRHRTKCTIQVEDPRLGALPTGWERIDREDNDTILATSIARLEN